MAMAVAAPELKDCPPTTADENRALITEFFSVVFNQSIFDNVGRWISPSFIEHNPKIRNGHEGLLKDIQPLLDESSKGSVQIARTIAVGDYVWIHSKAVVGGKKFAYADIYRIKCGRAIEHWDVIQEMVPSKVNDHAYF